MSHNIRSVSACILPEKLGVKRDENIPIAAQFSDYAEKYDYYTLYYQAIDEGRYIRLIAPKLHNFRTIINDADWSINNEALKLQRIRTFRRHNEILLKKPKSLMGEKLRMHYQGFESETDILKTENFLKNRQILLTKQKNNPLNWIRVWAEYHVQNQGVDSIVIIDNGSTDYHVEELSQALSAVKGLNSSLVIDAPFPFGAISRTNPRNKGLYYQAAMLNLVKHGYAREAKAVLTCVDIDELVVSKGEKTVFEALGSQFWGYMNFQGHWRYAPNPSAPYPLHSDHIYRSETQKFSKEKYALTIHGKLRFLPWDIHNIGRGRLNKFFMHKDFFFYHCEQLSTSWAVNRKEPTASDLAIDEDAQAFFAQFIQPIEQAQEH